MNMPLPPLPLAEWIDAVIHFLTVHFAFITRAISSGLGSGVEALVSALTWIPPWVLILLLVALAWWLAGRWMGVFTVLGLLLLWNVGLWDATVATLALVVVATLIAVVIGLPLGVAAALFPGVKRVVVPVLDFMQTMPAFVYLIPAIPFFGLGTVSAIFSTVIFSMPPAIRLTYLGIEQVPEDLIEAADAFGSSRRQKLWKIQLPIATPTIMAGINQTIMLSLSMVVIAAMIGARGLGEEVWKAIQRVEAGKGFVAGLGVVIVAIILDRITQSIGRRGQKARA